jgi:hypothetical protein
VTIFGLQVAGKLASTVSPLQSNFCAFWEHVFKRSRGPRSVVAVYSVSGGGPRSVVAVSEYPVISDATAARPSTIIWLRPQAASGQCVTPPQACCWTSVHLPDIIQYGLGATVWAAVVGLPVAVAGSLFARLEAIPSGVTPSRA